MIIYLQTNFIKLVIQLYLMQCIQMSIHEHGPLQFKHGFPVKYEGPFLAGANAISVQDDDGTIVIQEIVTHEYSLRHTFVRLVNKTIIKGITLGEGLYSRVMRKNKLCHNIKGAGKITLREKEFSLIRADGISGSITYRGKKEYETFDCWFSPSLLHKIAPSFPSIQSILENDPGGKTILLSKRNKTIDKKTDAIIHEMLHCPYSDDLQRFYFETKVNEYLLSLLATNDTIKPEKPPTEYQIRAVYKAREIAINNSAGRYTIAEIARMVALNASDLKRIYMQVFGIGIFETHLEKKMQQAREFITETGKPLKEIAAIAGYKWTGNFNKAFKKYYGETPLQYRRNC